MEFITADWFQKHLLVRPSDGHKKTFGHVLVVGGSEGKYGAPMLTAKAALRAGCGLVTACVPEKSLQALLTYCPEIMSISSEKEGFLSEISLESVDAIAIGPGLGIQATSILTYFLTHFKGPIVIDADAINILSANPELQRLLSPQHILTPHLGEFSRLMGEKLDIENSLQKAFEFVEKRKVNLVLKGKNSKIFVNDGLVYENTSGNAGMATAGSGDVLTGIIASLCAQGYSPSIAACMGVYLHGLAGDKAIESQNEASLIASDLVEALKLIMNYEL
ncbi:NAD(P)H-hydrate dehydratase [Aquirufa sp. ROCK-SH2]